MLVHCVIGLAAVAGCNWAYGLDETRSSAPRDLSDEDLDDINNTEDNCPGLTNTDQLDLDGDEVGDVCDLLPAVPGDRIIARHMFNAPAFARADWVGDGFAFHDGYVDQPLDTRGGQIFTKKVPTGSQIVVEARITPLRFETLDQNNRIGITVEGPVGPICIVLALNPGAALRADSGTIADTKVLSTLELGIPLTLLVTVDRAAQQLTCKLGVLTATVPLPAALPDAIGLFTKLDAARVDYVVIYARD